MADKKKYRRAKKNDVLMPHVADDALVHAADEPLSAEELRVKDAVDELYRDLFGESAKREAPPAPVAVSEPELQEEEGEGFVESEEETPLQDDLIAADESDTYPVRLGESEIFFEKDTEDGEILPLKEELEGRGDVFRFLLDMEYEKELGDAIGFERIRAYHERNINGKKTVRQRNEAQREEYDRPDKDVEAAIARRYRRQHSGWLMRLALSVLLFLLTLCYENGTWMASLFGGPFDGAKYPVSYILIGMQLLVFGVILCYRPLWEGLRHILRLTPVDHSAHVGVILITLVYHVSLLLVSHTECPTLLLSPAMLCLVLLTVGELLNSYRESLAFPVISKRQQKYAVLPRVSVGSVEESARARLHMEAGRGSVWYLRPISFVRDYFTNTARHVSRHRNLGAHFLSVLGLGCALSLFALAGGAQVSRALGFAFVAVLLGAPVITAVLTSLPLFFAAIFSLKGKAAIVGEIPLEKVSAGDTLVLPGEELFYSMEREHFRLLGLCDVHRVSVYLRALLEKLQSPLADAFPVDDDSRLSTAEITLSHIGDEGVCADIVRQGCRIALGTAEYMTARGMSFKPVTDGKERSLYVALDEQVCAAFYVRYVLNAELEPLVRDMRRVGLKLAVRSKDPCIREDVFDKLLDARAGRVTVQKPTASELDLRLERVDATVVALNSCTELARAVVMCRRVSRVGVWGKILQLICALGGAALAALLTFFGVLLPGVLVTVWILFWCSGYTMLSYFYLHRSTEEL